MMLADHTFSFAHVFLTSNGEFGSKIYFPCPLPVKAFSTDDHDVDGPNYLSVKVVMFG
jgi:hypothetical protein